MKSKNLWNLTLWNWILWNMKLHLYEFMKSIINIYKNIQIYETWIYKFIYMKHEYIHETYETWIYTKIYKFDFKNYMNCTKNYENVNYIYLSMNMKLHKFKIIPMAWLEICSPLKIVFLFLFLSLSFSLLSSMLLSFLAFFLILCCLHPMLWLTYNNK